MTTYPLSDVADTKCFGFQEEPGGSRHGERVRCNLQVIVGFFVQKSVDHQSSGVTSGVSTAFKRQFGKSELDTNLKLL